MSIVNPVKLMLEPPEITNRRPMSCMSSVVEAAPMPDTTTFTGLFTLMMFAYTGAERRYTPVPSSIVHQGEDEHFTKAALSASVHVPAAEQVTGTDTTRS